MACIKEGMMRCVRCKGRKKVYKIGNIYSYTNTGGQEVDCPMCLGEGNIKTLDKAVEDATAKVKQLKKSEKILKKDLNNGEQESNKPEKTERK